MRPGERFSFLVAPDVAGRMDRVVLINDGRIVKKEQQDGDVLFTVEKS
jgi:hypothetical protein